MGPYSPNLVMAKIGFLRLLTHHAGSKMKIYYENLFRGASLVILNEKFDYPFYRDFAGQAKIGCSSL